MNILITGGRGLLGSALKVVDPRGHRMVFIDRYHCDLMKYDRVKEWVGSGFAAVIHTAGRVGGIGRNLNSPAQQFHENIIINTNVIHACYETGVNKLIAFSSACAFPANVSPFVEENFHHGEPFPAHRSYAYAKRMVDIQIEAYRQQYNVNYCCVIPGNLLGPGDNYSLTESHVIPALIHKAYIANKENTPLEVWGDGSASREFIYSEDLACACMDMLESSSDLPQRLIISGEREYKIKDIAEIIAKCMKVDSIKWLTDKPNGQLSRPSSIAKFRSMFPSFKFTNMEDAIKSSCEWFINNYSIARK
jgi:GDP-L-fucose synthase